MSNTPNLNKQLSIGIDFGTTKSAISYTNLTEPRPQPTIGTIKAGFEFCPTVVYIIDQQKPLSGLQAEGYWRSEANKVNTDLRENNRRFLRDFKLRLGDSQYNSELRRHFSLEGASELAALIIEKLRMATEYAEKCENIKEAVITYPAGWGLEKKQELILAANIAGIDNPILLKEPTAALYEIDRHRSLAAENSKNIVVVDFGGGTCDITVCRTAKGSFLTAREPEILAEQTENIGGKNIDDEIVNFLIKKFREQFPDQPEDVLTDYLITLKQAAKEHKEKFSDIVRVNRMESQMYGIDNPIVDYFFEIPHLPNDLTLTVSWNEIIFEEIIKPLIARIADPLYKALQKANLERKEIDLVALVGGSSSLPSFENLAKSMFSPHSVEVYVPPQPRHAVVYGAAIFHYYEKKPKLRAPIEGRKRYSSLRIGLIDDDTKVLIKANEKIPIETRRWECKTPEPNLGFIDIIILEGEKDGFEGNETYAIKRVHFKEPVPKGTRISLEYAVDQQDIFSLYACLKDHPETGEHVIGRQSISQQQVEAARKRLHMPKGD